MLLILFVFFGRVEIASTAVKVSRPTHADRTAAGRPFPLPADTTEPSTLTSLAPTISTDSVSEILVAVWMGIISPIHLTPNQTLNLKQPKTRIMIVFKPVQLAIKAHFLPIQGQFGAIMARFCLGHHRSRREAVLVDQEKSWIHTSRTAMVSHSENVLHYQGLNLLV